MRKLILAGLVASLAFAASAQSNTSPLGEYKGKPTVGMQTLWGLKDKNGVWSDGNGYKPSENTRFKARRVKLVDGGKKLEVTGCRAVLCRTATWVRVN